MSDEFFDISSNAEMIDWPRLRELILKTGCGTIYPVAFDSNEVFPENNNDLCQCIQESPLGLNRCQAIHQLHLKEIRENLRPSIFRCHAGFWNMAIPLHLDDICIGAVMGCGVLDQSRKSIDYTLLAQEISVDAELLLAAVRKVPLLNKAKIIAMQSLLYLFLQDLVTSRTINRQTQRKLHSFEKAILKYNTLYKIYKVTRKTPDLAHLLSGLIKIISDDTASDAVFIYLLDEQNELVLTGASEEFSGYIGEVVLDNAVLLSILLEYEYSKLTGHPLPVVKTKGARTVSDIGEYTSVLIVPLITNNAVIGVLMLKSNTEGVYDTLDKQFSTFINVISAQYATAIENTLLRRQTELLTLTDEMTDLYNFRYFSQKLTEEITRCARYGHMLSLIMVDLDMFKDFNDTFGHPAGDTALSILAIIMKNNIRDVDMAARYGGEEFAIILPETGPQEARNIIERIREKVANYDFVPKKHKKYRNLTISAGIASFPGDAQTKTDLIARADQALYFSKTMGRNRITSFGDEPQLTIPETIT